MRDKFYNIEDLKDLNIHVTIEKSGYSKCYSELKRLQKMYQEILKDIEFICDYNTKEYPTIFHDNEIRLDQVNYLLEFCFNEYKEEIDE